MSPHSWKAYKKAEKIVKMLKEVGIFVPLNDTHEKRIQGEIQIILEENDYPACKDR